MSRFRTNPKRSSALDMESPWKAPEGDVVLFPLLCVWPAGAASCFSPAVPTGDSDITVEKADNRSMPGLYQSKWHKS